MKKFQGVGCSLTEINDMLQENDENPLSNQQVIEWIRHKIKEIQHKKAEYDPILDTLNRMLQYKIALEGDPQKAHRMWNARHSEGEVK